MIRDRFNSCVRCPRFRGGCLEQFSDTLKDRSQRWHAWINDRQSTCPLGKWGVIARNPTISAHREWTPDQASRGLGDTIAKGTHQLGIKQCKGCRKRQERANELISYKTA